VSPATRFTPCWSRFRVGLWVFSFVCYLICRLLCALRHRRCSQCGSPRTRRWFVLRKSPIVRTVLTHMALNLLALLMFVMSFLARSIEAPFSWSLTLSAIGLVSLAIGGWFGGELVFVHGLGVEPAAEHRHPIQAQSEPPPRSLR
jgi:Predicted membrane protein (DUF2231)